MQARTVPSVCSVPPFHLPGHIKTRKVKALQQQPPRETLRVPYWERVLVISGPDSQKKTGGEGETASEGDSFGISTTWTRQTETQL